MAYILGVLLALLAPIYASSSLIASSEGSDAWKLNFIDVKGHQPDARQGHAAIEVGRTIYIIGGCLQEIKCFNDVHVFDSGTNKWSEERTSGERPAPRGGHTATLVGSDIFIFGGANSEETFGDVYRFDLVKRRWTRFETPIRSPTRRTSHAAAVDTNGRIYTFGGYDADGNYLNDLWLLKAKPTTSNEEEVPTASWSRLVPSGNVPLAREGHSLTLVDKKLVLFGGYTSKGKAMNDVHAYDLISQTWNEVEASGPLPAPRQAHSAVRHGHDVIIAGGCDVAEESPKCFNDVWSLSLIDMSWTKRTLSGSSWKAREGHTASFIAGEMYSFGGCQLGSQCFSDMTVLDTLDPCPAQCGRHGECVHGAYCKCTEPGFTGHDCMQPLSCSMDCGLHGVCSQDGRCSCEGGWSGENCEVAPRCPGSPLVCSGRGECLPGGHCRCQPGAAGIDCFEDVQVVKANASEVALRKHKLSLLFMNERKGNESAPASPKDFGIAKINDGRIGQAGAPDCKDSCNWRGLCDAGACYCQPGFTGETCGEEQVPDEAKVSLLKVMGFAGFCFIFSLLATTFLLSVRARSKRAQEEEKGFVVPES